MTKVFTLSLLSFMIALSAGCGRNGLSTPTGSVIQPTQREEEMSDPEIAKLDEAIRKSPSRALLYVDRGTAWYYRDRFDLAFRDYDEAIRLEPTNSVCFDARGFAHHMNNRQEEKALADYAEAIRLDPNNHHALNNRAYLLATTLDDRFRNGEKALEDATKACEMTGWKKPGYLDTLAVAYAEVGDFEQAIRWQKKALEDPVYVKEWGENARAQIELFRKKKPYRE